MQVIIDRVNPDCTLVTETFGHNVPGVWYAVLTRLIPGCACSIISYCVQVVRDYVLPQTLQRKCHLASMINKLQVPDFYVIHSWQVGDQREE